MKKKYYYPSGLPFSEILAQNLDSWMERLEQDKAVLIVIDGIMGSGKTTLGIHCADYINNAYKKNQQGTYDLIKKNLIKLNKHLGMGGEEFMLKLRDVAKENKKIAIYDEAGDFSRRGAMSSFNKKMSIIFQTYRKFKVAVIATLPAGKRLDNSIFTDGISRCLINVHDRGKRSSNFRAYDIDRTLWVLHFQTDKKMVNPMRAYSKVSPNFRGHFLDLPPEREKELDELTGKGKSKIIDQTTLSMNTQGLVNYAQIAEHFNRSIIWARMKISKKQLKPVKIIEKKAYFTKNILKQLEEE